MTWPLFAYIDHFYKIIMCSIHVSVMLFTVVSTRTESLHVLLLLLLCFDVFQWKSFHFVILLVVNDAEFCLFDVVLVGMLLMKYFLHRRRRRGGHIPLKFGKTYFSGNYYVKFGHFSSKNYVKFRNFVNFSGKYYKNSGILTIFRLRTCKIWAFCSFFRHFYGQKHLPPPPLKLTELLRL